MSTPTQSVSSQLIRSDPPIIEKIRPLEWYTLRYWVRETAVYDRRKYRSQKRPITFNRVMRMKKPNLDSPIFVLGAPRSGTTFLGTCVETLPEVSYHFEPIAIKAATSYVYTDQWSTARAKRFYPRVYRWLMRLHFDADLRLADKTPRNSLIVPALYKAFPKAQFIFIQRDGRDAALSLSKKLWYQNQMKGQNIKEPAGYTFGPEARFWVEPARAEEFENTTDIHRCVWIWRQFVEHVLAAKPTIPQNQFHELRYEDLVTQPDLAANRLLDFLDISASDSRAQFVDFVGKNAQPTSIGNWKRELSLEQRQQVEQEAGALLESLGYGCQQTEKVSESVHE